MCLFKIIMPLQFSDLPHFVEEKLQHAYNTEHLEIYIVLPYLFTKLQYRCLTFHTITFHIGLFAFLDPLTSGNKESLQIVIVVVF